MQVLGSAIEKMREYANARKSELADNIRWFNPSDFQAEVDREIERIVADDLGGAFNVSGLKGGLEALEAPQHRRSLHIACCVCPCRSCVYSESSLRTLERWLPTRKLVHKPNAAILASHSLLCFLHAYRVTADLV